MPLIYHEIRVSTKRKFLLFLLSFVAGVFRFVLAKQTRASQAIVIEPFGMGDAISILPLVRNLCESFDNVYVITKGQWAPLFEEIPKATVYGVNLPWSSYSMAGKYRFSNWLNSELQTLLSNLKPIAKGAIGFDPRGDIRSILFLYLIGCSTVYTLDHYLGTDAKIPKWAAQTKKIDQHQQRWRVACDLAASAGYKKSCAGPPLLKSGLYNPRPVKKIAFLPIAPWKGRLWPSERWRELYYLIRNQGFKIHGFCGPDQKKQAQDMLGIKEIKECITIDSWIKAFSEIDLLITVDSGPMHLADALGVPLIALFGPGQLPMWSPSGAFARVLSHQESRHFQPIHQIEGNEWMGNEWMGKITTEEVWNCFLSLIKNVKS